MRIRPTDADRAHIWAYPASVGGIRITLAGGAGAGGTRVGDTRRMAGVVVTHLRTSHGGAAVLHDVSFAVEDGTIFALLGPSGSGKTSVLRAIAGLDPVTAGTVVIGDEDVTSVPASRRDVAMVFEDATLLPHLDLGRNVGFPLEVRRVPSAEIRERVTAEARVFSLTRLLRRRPAQVSDGERQKAATAHALVRRPAVILMDEPLARVDERTRAAALKEILTVQAGYGVTLVVATNDQAVAASLAGQVAVLESGRVRQVATFMDLYARPADTFVASFVGDPPMNLLPGVAGRHLRVGPTTLPLAPPAAGPVTVGVRPEHLDLVAPEVDGALPATIGDVRVAGSAHLVRADLDDGTALTLRVAHAPPEVGARVGLWLRRLTLFDQEDCAIVHDLAP